MNLGDEISQTSPTFRFDSSFSKNISKIKITNKHFHFCAVNLERIITINEKLMKRKKGSFLYKLI